MRKYAEMCKGICGTIQCVIFFSFPIKKFSFCGALFRRIWAWEGRTSKTWFLDLNSPSPCHLSFGIYSGLYSGVDVSILQNYTYFEDQITSAKSENKKIFFTII